jgi:hypothetical protein
MNQSVGPASESASFISINPEVCIDWYFVSYPAFLLQKSKELACDITTHSLLPCLNYWSSWEKLVSNIYGIRATSIALHFNFLGSVMKTWWMY